MLKDFFIKQGIKEAQIDDFIKQEFPLGDYSKIELQRTPLGIKIIIYTNKPGRIIGRGGKNINDITEAVKKRFDLENPQLDVRSIQNPNLDSNIVAKQIAAAIERGYNYKKIGNLTLKRILAAGAVGAEIVISGKLTGGKSMTNKFIDGYLKHSGHTGKVNVDTAFFVASTKPGSIGIHVKIMKDFVDISGQLRKKHATEDAEKIKEVEESKTKEEAKPKEKTATGKKNKKEKDKKQQKDKKTPKKSKKQAAKKKSSKKATKTKK